MSNDSIVVRGGSLEPDSVAETIKLAQVLVASKMLPKSVSTPEAAFAIILTGRELGLSPMQALRSIHVVEGRPTLSADLMAALVLRHPDCKRFQMIESSEKVATYETDRCGVVTRLSFTIEEAKAAGLTSRDNYRKYAPAMLRARCISALARVAWPDLLVGCYESTSEELTPVPRSVSVDVVPETDLEPLADSETMAARHELIDACETLDSLRAILKAIKSDTQTYSASQKSSLSQACSARADEIKRAAAQNPAVAAVVNHFGAVVVDVEGRVSA